MDDNNEKTNWLLEFALAMGRYTSANHLQVKRLHVLAEELHLMDVNATGSPITPVLEKRRNDIEREVWGICKELSGIGTIIRPLISYEPLGIALALTIDEAGEDIVTINVPQNND